MASPEAAQTSIPLSARQHRAIRWNAALWMAGQTLTSGAFLSYFAVDLGASSLLLGFLAAAPELVGSSGLLSRWLTVQLASRKVLWLVCTLLARAFTLLIPFAGAPLIESWGLSSPWMVLGLVVISQSFQGIATTLYFAWLSDLTTSQGWGQLFAGRNIASLLVQMTVPVIGGLLRDHWKRSYPAEELWWAYVIVFSLGIGFLLISIWPMWTIADPESDPRSRHDKSKIHWSVWFRDRSLRRLFAHSWCLAIANGLTQAAFFKYQITVVGLSLTGYFLLADIMYGLQVVASLWAGRCRTAADHRHVLFQGTLITTFAMPFWFLASREQWWWLIGAFVCWGAFGAVNVAGPNLLFSLSPRHETTIPLALFRQVAGTLAGLSGIVGGWWLDQLSVINEGGKLTIPMTAFWIIFATSWIGRVIAALLVLRVSATSDPIPNP